MPPNTVKEDFARILKLRHFADGVAMFGPKIVAFHRGILAAASPSLFNVLLQTSGMSKNVPTYQFEKLCSGTTFESLLEMLYTGVGPSLEHNGACQLIEHVVGPWQLPHVRDI